MKGIAIVKFTDESGKERKAFFRIENPESYLEGQDVVIRYTEYEGDMIALPADNDLFYEEEKSRNRFWLKTVLQILKAVLQYCR